MSDEAPHSGSRWEPEQHTAEANRSVAVAETEPTATIPAYLSAATPPPMAPPPMTPSDAVNGGSGRRRAVAAAVGAALLLVGGAGGYAIGHATAVTSGTAGTSSHERGAPGGFREGHGGDRGGTGTTGGAGTGSAGGGGTGTSGNTGTGSST